MNIKNNLNAGFILILRSPKNPNKKQKLPKKKILLKK